MLSWKNHVNFINPKTLHRNNRKRRRQLLCAAFLIISMEFMIIIFVYLPLRQHTSTNQDSGRKSHRHAAQIFTSPASLSRMLVENLHPGVPAMMKNNFSKTYFRSSYCRIAPQSGRLFCLSVCTLGIRLILLFTVRL